MSNEDVFKGSLDEFNELPDDFKEKIGKWVPRVSAGNVLLKYDFNRFKDRVNPYLVVADEYDIAIDYEDQIIWIYWI